jgi:Protein kinase domain.
VKCVEKKQLSGAAVDNIITEITLLKMLKHEYIVEMKDFQWNDRFVLCTGFCNLWLNLFLSIILCSEE